MLVGGVPSVVLDVEAIKVVGLAVDELTEDDVVAAERVVEGVIGTKTVVGLTVRMLEIGLLVISLPVLVGDTPEVSDNGLLMLSLAVAAVLVVILVVLARGALLISMTA